MPKVTAVFRCDECGNEVAKWLGRCPECQAWGSVEEIGVPKPRTVKAGPDSAPARPIDHHAVHLNL